MKKLSIITICYNEPNLEKTCESIVNQTWQNFEWIVIDGGSNEATQKIWHKYKYRINKFVSEKDNGRYDGCNKGIRHAEGEYVQFLNAGDLYHSNDVLEKVFSENQNADILYGEQFTVHRDNLEKSYTTKLPEAISTKFLITSNIHTPAVFIKRSLFEECGCFSEEYKIVSDYEKWIVFYKNGKVFKHIDLVVADFVLGGISSNKKTEKLHHKERELVINKYFTKEEIKEARRQYKDFSFFERIFSVTNSYDGKRKVITILGLHIKIRRKARA